jgi:16S rRNA (cytosine1407-C5)-methyltransferase
MPAHTVCRICATPLPEPFLERLRRIVPPPTWDAVANTFAQPKPTTFRVNTLKAKVEEVQAEVEAHGCRLQGVRWYPTAFILREGRLRELQETNAYREGRLYVQSLSSMVPPLVLDPKPGELVLDLAAAPGSKTTQMACLMRGEGRIVANDSHRTRIYKLQANVALQGARNVEVTRRPGEAIGRTQPEQFDRVLVDVPCSTEGRFQVREPETYQYWKPVKIREMVRKQRRLLAAGIHALRPGGVLVYATCTFAPEENEGVVQGALERFGAAITVEPITPRWPRIQPGLVAWDGQRFHPSLRHTMRILPTDEMEGFFVARLRKRTSG